MIKALSNVALQNTESVMQTADVLTSILSSPDEISNGTEVIIVY